ncbi:formate/nitrite transporter family protein [Actinotalea fermentans]|uniref:Nitrite transporter NirC n=1 Tax=Actinotalea fermentans TaxID=43671 RepID=A0A511YY28_9CELL|nr:formate/nitrite transporter family protein [Actinotalea fermentans]KGM15176.1 formate/nitrite transporter [Actinotalea fermentans ATCC 43279 = JCM 9966 = DSM 3133]GEN80115.1 hypothetical protein AFE02nite_18490 [Actinotalea fermentans]
MLSLTDTMTAQAATAATKARGTARPLAYLVQSMYGGAFIGVAVVLMFSAAGPLRAADSPWAPLVQGLVFGVALTLVVAAGAELATSNMMTLTQGALRRELGWGRAGGTLAFSFLGNMAGAFVFGTMVHLTGLTAPTTAAGQMLAGVLEAKGHETVGQLFWRGVLCNALVCLAIWAGARMRSEVARLIVIFWCLLAFITSGFEHVVANMTTFALGLVGALPETSWAAFAENMVVVGLGNLVGGAVVIGAGYAYAAGRPTPVAAPVAAPVTTPVTAPVTAQAAQPAPEAVGAPRA